MAEEEKLLMRLKNRKRNAIDEAIEVYTPYLSTVLYNMLGNRLPKEDIEEILSDVFVTLWKNADTIDLEKGTLRAYLAAVARNFALKKLNKQRDYTSLDEIELPDEAAVLEENTADSVVWDAVMSLGEPDNEIFVRYYKFGEKIREIAKATRRKPIYRKNQAFQRKTKTERNFITCGGTVMKQKNDLFKELNINPKNRDVCSPFAVDIQAIKRNVNRTLDSAYTERKTVIMKSKKKTACIALAATLALSVTAFAANGIVSNWFSSSSAIADYKTLPTAQQVKNDIGYIPILIDSFANGYTFKDGNIINNNLEDENGNSIEKFKSVSFDYEKDGDIVIFAQNKYNSQAELQGSVAKTVGDTDIYYYSYTNKVVPADYELTDADKAAEANGDLVFSYGSAEVELNEIQSATFVKDGMQYQLLQINGKLSGDELVKMAEELVA